MESLVNKEIDIFDNFFYKKTVLVTGHTGFKGSWLVIWLKELGANVIGVSLEPFSNKDNYVLSQIGNDIVDLRVNINDSQSINDVFKQYKPEIVFHLAAQPLVRLSYKQPVETFQTNVIGTINIMEGIRSVNSVKAGIMITTDKCYDNKEQIWGYRENEPIGGYDPYSASKGAAEVAIASWRRSFHLPIASVRAGNVIGGGDWALDRIIPDCIKAFEANQAVILRNPSAIRPWQLVLEPLYGYMLLAKKIYENPEKYSEAWNFGPNLESVSTVKEVVNLLIHSYGNGRVEYSEEQNQLHEANLLMLDIAKAKFILGWQPRLNISQCIEYVADWYKRYKTESVYDLCVEQICKFVQM